MQGTQLYFSAIQDLISYHTSGKYDFVLKLSFVICYDTSPFHKPQLCSCNTIY